MLTIITVDTEKGNNFKGLQLPINISFQGLTNNNETDNFFI